MRTLLKKQVDTASRVVSGRLGRQLILREARLRLHLLASVEVFEAGEALDDGIFISVKSLDRTRQFMHFSRVSIIFYSHLMSHWNLQPLELNQSLRDLNILSMI